MTEEPAAHMPYIDTRLPRTKKEQAKLNKDRAKRMEKYIAQYLNGNRVPMSGSGSMKGDCIVPLDEYRSIYVECKLTEKRVLNIAYGWLEDINKHTVSMRCVFGILVVYYFRRGYYVFVSDKGMDVLQIDKPLFYTNARKRLVVPEEWFFTEKGIETEHGNWYTMKLADFRAHLQAMK